MRFLFVLLNAFFFTAAFAQPNVSGVVADSLNKQVLPFATVQASNKKAVLSDINGRFTIAVPESVNKLVFSYSGYQPKQIAVTDLQPGDTVFLSPKAADLAEVIIQPANDKIRRIVNNAVENKRKHNPELYDFYQCNIYYKMHTDLSGMRNDSSGFFSPDKYLLFSETYSRRLYKRPQQLQETILASRFSGLKKTYFTNMITDVLPFHVYGNFINLAEKDYINPIAAGWQQRYRFRLEEELTVDDDTVYVFSFSPKASFNALQGIVYINTNGYAISHIIAKTANDTADRQIRFEQIYSFTKGRWFPKELNYDFNMRHMLDSGLVIKLNGHSVIDSVSFDPLPRRAFDKAHPIKLGDSMDVQSENDWAALRKDSLTVKEKRTYQYVDSFVVAHKLERLMPMFARLSLGRFPIGKLDVDVTKLLVSNDYEGTRWGLGLYTNDKISRYYSAGGWAGYGVRDKKWKYGASLTIYPDGKKENWLQFSYQKNYNNPGEVILHEELQNRFGNWLLSRVDLAREYAATANLRFGYWELRPAVKLGKQQPLYPNSFTVNGAFIPSFTTKEASLNLRYAYGEKRYPVFDYYETVGTRYPIAYLRVGKGSITATSYGANYIRVLAAVTFKHHTNRWGRDNFRIDGGFITTTNHQPLPSSFLLAANGFHTNKISFYVPGGFLTMRPYDFFSDRYASFYYIHDFDKFFWDKKWSKPYLGIAHNLVYGGLQNRNQTANATIRSLANGYHESGILVNQLLRINVRIGDLYLNGGVFYHWNKEADWQHNTTWVVGVSAGF